MKCRLERQWLTDGAFVFVTHYNSVSALITVNRANVSDKVLPTLRRELKPTMPLLDDVGLKGRLHPPSIAFLKVKRNSHNE